MSSHSKGVFMALSGAVLWGIMGIFVRSLNAFGFTSIDIAFFRCLLSGVAFMIFNAVTNPKALKVDFKGLIICALYGIISYSVGFVSYGISIERIPVAVATVLMFMSPVWIALLSRVVFKEKLSAKNGISIVVCIIGAVLVSNVIGVGNVKLDVLGIICGLLNGFGVALQVCIPRYFSDKYSKDTMLVYGFLAAGIVFAFFTDFGVVKAAVTGSKGTRAIFDIIFISLVCTMVANVSMVKSTSYISATVSGILSAIEVVVGALIGLLLYKESMSALQAIGAVIVVLGSLAPNVIHFEKKKE